MDSAKYRDITDAVRALIEAVQPYAQTPDEAEPLPPYRPAASTSTTIKTRRLDDWDAQDQRQDRAG